MPLADLSHCVALHRKLERPKELPSDAKRNAKRAAPGMADMHSLLDLPCHLLSLVLVRVDEEGLRNFSSASSQAAAAKRAMQRSILIEVLARTLPSQPESDLLITARLHCKFQVAGLPCLMDLQQHSFLQIHAMQPAPDTTQSDLALRGLFADFAYLGCLPGCRFLLDTEGSESAIPQVR